MDLILVMNDEIVTKHHFMIKTHDICFVSKQHSMTLHQQRTLQTQPNKMQTLHAQGYQAATDDNVLFVLAASLSIIIIIVIAIKYNPSRKLTQILLIKKVV